MKYLSALLTDARASIGGATASKNRGGNYFRARIAPVQPRTPAQQAVRANLATFAAGWRGLTQAQIAAWNALAAQIVRKDTLGNSYSPTGEQLYVGNNQNLATASDSPVVNPPSSPPSFPGPIIIDASAAAGTAAFTVGSGLAASPTGYKFLVRATPQLSAGISFVGRSRYRSLGPFAPTAFASINILSAYNDLFGDLVAGAVIGVALSLVETSSGFASLLSEQVIVVAA